MMDYSVVVGLGRPRICLLCDQAPFPGTRPADRPSRGKGRRESLVCAPVLLIAVLFFRILYRLLCRAGPLFLVLSTPLFLSLRLCPPLFRLPFPAGGRTRLEGCGR